MDRSSSKNIKDTYLNQPDDGAKSLEEEEHGRETSKHHHFKDGCIISIGYHLRMQENLPEDKARELAVFGTLRR